jgi:hypothetical protein
MTDSEVQQYLEDNGYPAHIVRSGRAGLIRRWREFVAEVERGYEFGLEDYRNDLDIRGIVQLIGAEDAPEITDADARLQAMLTGREARVWESVADDPWWDFGYPANASGELRHDLQAEGLIA